MMTVQEYERLKKIDTTKVYTGLRETVSRKMRYIDEEYVLIAAYTLYFLQKYPEKKYETVDDFKSDYLDDENDFWEVYYNSHHLLDQGVVNEEIGSWDDIQPLVGKYSLDELAACVLFGNHNSEKDVPAGMEQLLQKILKIQNRDKILDLSAGSGTLLMNYSVNYPKNRLVGAFAHWEDGHEGVIAYVRNRLTGGRTKFYNGTEIFEGKADRLIYNSEFPYLNKDIHPSIALMSTFPKDCSTPWKMAGYIPEHLNKNGKGAIIINSSFLSNREDKNVREYLIENKLIEKIVLLPEKLINDKQTAIVVLSVGNKKVKMVSSAEVSVSRRRRDRRMDVLGDFLTEVLEKLETGLEVSFKSVKENNYDLNPLKYMTIKQFQKKIGDVETVTLESLHYEVFRASQKNMLDIQLPEGETSSLRCVMAGDIVDGVVTDHLRYVKEECRETEKKFILMKNDLLITRNGNPFKIAVYTGENNEVMACGGLYIVRAKVYGADPYYLKAYFESEQGLRFLMDYSRVSENKIRSIMKTNLIEIPIPYPDMEVRNVKAARCQEIVEDIERKRREIDDYKAEMNRFFSNL